MGNRAVITTRENFENRGVEIMDKNYIKFVIAYDFGDRFADMGLACDEAYELADKIADMFIKYDESKAEFNTGWYDSYYEFCKDISFEELWDRMKIEDKIKKIITYCENYREELKSYMSDDDYSDLEKHDCKVIIEHIESILRYIHSLED